MKAFVITIDLPESDEAANKCISSGKTYGVEVEKHQGYMPKDDPEQIAKELSIDTKRFHEKYSRFENCLAAFLSHRALWEYSIVMNEEVLVLEHDAIFIDEVPRVPFKGVLSLGAPSYGKFNTPSSIGVNKLVSKQYLPGAHAYLVKPYAARALCEKALNYACPTDLFLRNELFTFIEEYYPWPVLARDSFTTIQKTEGCTAKHRYGESYKIL